MTRCVLRAVAASSAILLMVGCAGVRRSEHDARFARKLLDAIYGGSLAPIRESINPRYRIQLPIWATAALGEALDVKYGKVRDVTFMSSRELNLRMTQSTWVVSALKGSYQMKTVFDPAGRVIYMSFRPSPKDRWSPAPVMARDYIAQIQHPIKRPPSDNRPSGR